MKNVFAINIDADKMDGDSLICREINSELGTRQAKAMEKSNEYREDAALSWPLLILNLVARIVFVGVLAGVLGGIPRAIKNGTPFDKMLQNSWWIILIGAVAGVVVLILWKLEKQKANSIVESEGFKETLEESERLYTEVLAELNLPQETVQVDFLVYPYKISRSGKIKSAGMTKYINFRYFVFEEGENVCIANLGSVYAIPKAALKRIVKINKRVALPHWTKEEPYNSPSYKKYKVTVNNVGVFFVKPYYSLQFVVNKEEFEVLFPVYELETIEKITGLHAEEES